MVILSWILLTTPLQHLDQILDVFLKAFLPQELSNAEYLSTYFQSKIKPRLEKGQPTMTVWDQDKIIAFAIFEKWEEQSYYLAEMAVLPSYQGQGIGKRLVFSILDQDKEAKKILLVTEKRNLWSQGFYERIGFQHSSFQHPDYPENFIGYEYSLPLG